MVRILLAFALILTAGIRPVRAQDGRPEALESIRAAIGSADADAVLAHAGDRLELGVFTSTRTYSRSQARFVLREFFEENPPTSMALDRATGTPQGWFASGVYRSERAGAPVRVYLRLRLVGHAWQLRELVIREDS